MNIHYLFRRGNVNAAGFAARRYKTLPFFERRRFCRAIDSKPVFRQLFAIKILYLFTKVILFAIIGFHSFGYKSWLHLYKIYF